MTRSGYGESISLRRCLIRKQVFTQPLEPEMRIVEGCTNDTGMLRMILKTEEINHVMKNKDQIHSQRLILLFLLIA